MKTQQSVKCLIWWFNNILDIAYVNEPPPLALRPRPLGRLVQRTHHEPSPRWRAQVDHGVVSLQRTWGQSVAKNHKPIDESQYPLPPPGIGLAPSKGMHSQWSND